MVVGARQNVQFFRQITFSEITEFRVNLGIGVFII